MSARTKKLTLGELLAAQEALSARLAGEWGEEFGEGDLEFTREDAERAHEKLGERIERMKARTRLR